MELKIPDDIPTGLVIGRQCKYITNFKKKHCVKASVDTRNRLIRISGATEKVKDATEDLQRLFERFKTSGRCSYMHAQFHMNAVVDLEKYDWAMIAVEDALDAAGYPYKIVKSTARNSKLELPSNSKFLPFNDKTIETFKKKFEQTKANHMKCVIGTSRYKLINKECHLKLTPSDYANLNVNKDMKSTWSNVFDFTNPFLRGIYEQILSSESTALYVIHVYLADYDINESYLLKYFYIDKSWKLVHVSLVPQIIGFATFRLHDAELRFRASLKHSEGIEKVYDLAQKHIKFSVPSDSVLNTKVTLEGTPDYIEISKAEAKKKNAWMSDGLKWCLYTTAHYSKLEVNYSKGNEKSKYIGVLFESLALHLLNATQQ